MRYEKFIEYVLNGHEFIGFVCSHKLKILNVIEGCVTVIIDNDHKHYLYTDIEEELVYDNKTFKELYDYIELVDMF